VSTPRTSGEPLELVPVSLRASRNAWSLLAFAVLLTVIVIGTLSPTSDEWVFGAFLFVVVAVIYGIGRFIIVTANYGEPLAMPARWTAASATALTLATAGLTAAVTLLTVLVIELVGRGAFGAVIAAITLGAVVPEFAAMAAIKRLEAKLDAQLFGFVLPFGAGKRAVFAVANPLPQAPLSAPAAPSAG
jgi:hypothetical protein